MLRAHASRPGVLPCARRCSGGALCQPLCLSPQDLDEEDFDVGKPKKQRRSIVRTASMTRVGGNWFY